MTGDIKVAVLLQILMLHLKIVLLLQDVKHIKMLNILKLLKI